MSNTFTKTSLRGFTLIELLVVIAIIGLLSTAIMGPVQTGLKKGRDTRKISDLTQVQGALIQYAGDNNGLYPQFLTALDPTYMKTDAKMTTVSAARDRFMYVIYADAAGNPVQYHLGAALENQNASLQGDADCSIAVSGAATAIPGTPVTTDWGLLNGTTTLTLTDGTTPDVECADITGGALYNSNWSASGAGNPPATASSTDFGGAGAQEAANGVCTSKLTSCIYDVIPK